MVQPVYLYNYYLHQSFKLEIGLQTFWLIKKTFHHTHLNHSDGSLTKTFICNCHHQLNLIKSSFELQTSFCYLCCHIWCALFVFSFLIMFNLKICSQQTCSDVERDSLEEEDESKVHKPSKVNTIFKFYLL